MLHIYEKVHSKMSTVMITFDGGARSEEGEFSMGIAHMLEHMLGHSPRPTIGIPMHVRFTPSRTAPSFIAVRARTAGGSP